MAYVPTNPGWGAGSSNIPRGKQKKPAPARVGAANPYQAPTLGGFTVAELAKMSPSQIALISANLAAQGPDYSKVDFEKLRGIAASAAQSNYDQSSQPVWIERGWNTSRQKLSSDAATNFAAAMASILQGGKTGQEGMDYALQNYGGSYLGAIAGRMGQELISRQQDYFTGEDAQLAGELNKLWDQMPGEREKMYEELVKQGMEGVLTNHKNAIVALAALQDSKRKDAEGSGGTPKVRNFSDGTSRQYNPQTGKWDVVTSAADKTPYYSYTKDADGNLVVFDPTTGRSQIANPDGWVLKPPKTAAGAKVTAKTDRAGRPYVIQNGKVKLLPIPPGFTTEQPSGSGATSNGKAPSPSTVSNTVKRANAAGETALGKVTDNIWARTGNPPPEIEVIQDGKKVKIANPAFVKANAWYQNFLDSGKPFRSAMTRVVTAISPHLKALGYTPSQIKRAAYNIVSAEIDPPKGYKPPKADAAQPAAYREGPYSGGATYEEGPYTGGASYRNAVQGSQFANYTGPPPPDSVIYAQYKNSRPLPDAQLVAILRQAGFEGRGLQLAYSIAKRESGGNPLAFNPDVSTGDRSWGLFQINTLGSMSDRIKQFGLQSEMQLLDPLANARAAYRMTDGGKNWYHWGVDTGYGAYRNAPVTMLPLPAGSRA